MSFYDLIHNKRVVFVGACPNLLGLGHGKDIDKFDVIVRTNGSIEIVDQYAEDYGSRTDILYVNVQYGREMYPLPVESYKERGLQYLCCKAIADFILNDYNEHIPTRSVLHVVRKMQRTIPSALFGVCIINDLLSHKPKELFLTGIDFFASKKQVFEVDNYQEYLDGYLPKVIIEQGNVINQGKMEDSHNQVENTKYIYSLWKKGLVGMPKFIKKIMLDIMQKNEIHN